MSIPLDMFYKQLPDIAFYGKRRSGKDEAANIIKNMGFLTYQISFGKHLKHHFHATFPDIPMEPKPVEKLIEYGQAMRQIDPDVWIKKAKLEMENVRAFDNPRRSLINTDCRQQNEYDFLKSQGFIFVRIDAIKSVRVERMLALGETVKPEYLNNETEDTLDGFDYDYVIQNNGSPESFAKEITELVYLIQGGKL
ncbi:deoxynucleoside monophosphate kinase [Bacillus phage Eoghan]|uniref:Deoxynucleoside monophosphate kinase n=2 Tax=Andromedavirus TaxID=1623275 RepID=M1IQM1_9CAUD|nr:deoxynucleoside monophosphate kinase [Bacillus phage Eoghan]YP_009592285.1 deoxynucleoside monophosphate kinase [Bacillus phage Taylor]AGE60816.1 deoxynucleoside monophosphate kinase [Bacillus phage Eoghan]AGE60970.1 deoxynucleoside monophosphate kinase [Bacillus phage Taylor]